MTTGALDDQDGTTGPPPPESSADVTAGEPVVHRRSLLRNASAMVGGQMTTWVIALVVAVIVPYEIGERNNGLFRTATAVWAIAAMAMAFGTNTLVTLDVARRQTARSVRLGPVISARLLGFTLVLPFIAAFAWIADKPRLFIVLLGIVAVSTLLASGSDLLGAALTGLERLAPVAIGDVIVKSVGAVLMIAAVLITGDVRLVAFASIVALCVSVTYLYRSLRRLKPVDLRVPLGSTRRTIRRGSPYLVIGLTLVAYNQVDVIVMSLLVSDVEIGWYGAADQFFGTLLFVPTIVMSSLLPTLARSNAEDPSRASNLLVQVFLTVSLVSVPIGLGTFVIADPLVDLVYRGKYTGTGPVLAVYGIVLVLTFQTILLGQHAIATGQQRLWNIVLGVCIPITIVFDLIFVPIMHDRYGNGAIAGALAYIITEGLMVVVGIWKVAPALLSRSVGRRAVKTLVAGGAMVAATWPVRERFIAIPIAVGIVSYVVVLLLLRPLEPHEKTLVNRLAGRVPFARRLLG